MILKEKEARVLAQKMIEEMINYGGTGKVEKRQVDGHIILEVTLVIPIKEKNEKEFYI